MVGSVEPGGRRIHRPRKGQGSRSCRQGPQRSRPSCNGRRRNGHRLGGGVEAGGFKLNWKTLGKRGRMTQVIDRPDRLAFLLCGLARIAAVTSSGCEFVR